MIVYYSGKGGLHHAAPERLLKGAGSLMLTFIDFQPGKVDNREMRRVLSIMRSRGALPKGSP